MLAKAKTKSAAKRLQKAHNATKNSNKKNNFWTRVWNIICWPFRKIWTICCKVWAWLKTVDFVAMLNLTLLVTIIVMFSMLIMDVIGCTRKPVVVIAQPTQPIEQVVVTEEKAPTKITLPLAQHNNTQDKAPVVDIIPVKKAEVEIIKKQTAKQDNTLFGDVIIDSRATGAILQNNTTVKGNVFLQNMRKYVLPCDIHINGNLFLRDVNMLQFCGDFVITGNIYVSPKSSFGPIPKTARLGGHVVF